MLAHLPLSNFSVCDTLADHYHLFFCTSSPPPQKPLSLLYSLLTSHWSFASFPSPTPRGVCHLHITHAYTHSHIAIQTRNPPVHLHPLALCSIICFYYHIFLKINRRSDSEVALKLLFVWSASPRQLYVWLCEPTSSRSHRESHYHCILCLLCIWSAHSFPLLFVPLVQFHPAAMQELTFSSATGVRVVWVEGLLLITMRCNQQPAWTDSLFSPLSSMLATSMSGSMF